MDLGDYIRSKLDQFKNSVSQGAGNVVNAVGHEFQQLPQQISQIPQAIGNDFQHSQFGQELNTVNNIGGYLNSPQVQNFGQQVANVPIIKSNLNQPLLQFHGLRVPGSPTIGQFAQGQVIKPALTALNPQANPVDRFTGGVQTAFNVANPLGTGAFNVGTGYAAGALKTLRAGGNLDQNIAQSVAKPSDIGGSGLGLPAVPALAVDALTANPKGVVNGVKTLSAGLKGYSPNAFNIHPDDQKIMSDFVNAVQSTGGKGDLGQLGRDAQLLAEHYIGSSAKDISNQKLAQAFDALLSSAARNRGEDALQTPFPKMGFVQTPKIGNNLQDALAGARNPQDEATIVHQFTDNAIQNQSGNSLKATRAALNQDLNGLMGVQGKGKAQMDAKTALLSDPNIGPRVQALQENIYKIDQALKNPKEITNGQPQPATQDPALTKYENAFNGGDTKTMDALAAQHPGDARFQVHVPIADRILNQAPAPAKLSQQALEEGITNAKKGSDISVSPQSVQRLKAATEPLPWEQGIKGRGNSPTVLEKPPVADQPFQNFETGSQPRVPDTGVIDKKTGAIIPPGNSEGTIKDALGKRFEVSQQIGQRANVLGQVVDKAVQGPEETALFRNSIEHPENLNANALKASDPEAFKAAVSQFKQFTDYVHQSANENGVKLNYLPDYYSHIIDLSNPEDAARLQEFLKSKSNSTGYFTKERIFKNIDELQAAGFKLKNPNVPLDVNQYAASAIRSIGNSALSKGINKAEPGGLVNVSELGYIPRDQNGKPYIALKIPGLEGSAVSPEIYKHVSHLESAPDVNPLLGAFDKVNALGKEISLGGGGFHALKTTLRQIGIQTLNMKIPRLDEAFINAVSPAARLAYRQKAIADGTIDKASKMGVTLDTVRDVGSEGVVKLKSLNPLTQLHSSLFGGLINTYKMQLVRDANIEGKTPEEARQLGAQINNLMGGINLSLVQRSPVTQQWLRRFALAPDFNEGKIRQVATALKPSMGADANFSRKAILGEALAVGVLAEIGRKLATGKFSQDLGQALQNDVLNPDVSTNMNNPKGKKQSVGLPGSTITDISRAVQDPQHFLIARGSSALSAATKLATGKDYYGNPLVDPYTQQDTPVNRLKAVAKTELPIPAVQALGVAQGKDTPEMAALNTIGFRVHNDPNDPNNKATTDYFNGLASARNSLTPNDQAVFDTIHPQTKDSQGNSIIEKNAYTSPAKYETLLSNPKVMAAELAFQQSQPSHDPLWDWSPAQRQAYMQAQVISKNDPGGDKTTTSALYSVIPQQLFDQRTAYFNQLQSSGKMPQGSGPQSPQAPSSINAYTALPKGTGARTAFLQQHPELLKYFQDSSNYTNAQRADLGLPLLAQYGSGGGSGGSGGSGGVSALTRYKQKKALRLMTKPHKRGAPKIKLPKAKKSKLKTPKIALRKVAKPKKLTVKT